MVSVSHPKEVKTLAEGEDGAVKVRNDDRESVAAGVVHQKTSWLKVGWCSHRDPATD